MKITRKQNGYTIRCNDGEFAMLDQLISATAPDAARSMLADPSDTTLRARC